eukprot:5173110-Pleurochrysis_carterae.AAC.1
MTGTNIACAECPAFRLNGERDAGSIGLCERAAPASEGCPAGAASARASALLSVAFLGLRGQSRCQCLPPQWRQALNFGVHSFSK